MRNVAVAGSRTPRHHPWTPSQLANLSSLWFWGQPSVFGSDCPIEPTSPNGFVNKINNWGDRRSNTHSVKRFDGNQAGMPQWLGKSAVVRRPLLYYGGSTLLQSCVSNGGAAVAVQSTGGYTLAARLSPGPGSSGWFFGRSGSAEGVRAFTGVGVVVKNAAGQTVTNNATISNNYNETVIVVTVRGTAVRISVKDLVTGVTTIQSGTLAAGADVNGVLFVGTNGDATATFEGGINELLYVQTPCSDVDHDHLFAYLQNPYAVPLITAGIPVVWGFGDSRQVGMDSGLDLVTAIRQGVATNAIWHSAGLSGQAVADMVTNFTSREGNLLVDPSASGSQQVIVVECTVNTCSTHPGNAAAAFTDFQTYNNLLLGRDPDSVRIYGTGGDRSGTGIYAIDARYHDDFLVLAQLLRDNKIALRARLADTAASATLGALNWQHNRTYGALDDFGSGNTAEVHWTPTGISGAAGLYRPQLPFT